MFLFLTQLKAQTTLPKENQDSLYNHIPQEKITVNKEYDKDGNLIRYDSTYSYSYSSTESHRMIMDSLQQKYFQLLNPNFTFPNDSMQNNFIIQQQIVPFGNDEIFRQQMEIMGKMYQQQDSTKSKTIIVPQTITNPQTQQGVHF